MSRWKAMDVQDAGTDFGERGKSRRGACLTLAALLAGVTGCTRRNEPKKELLPPTVAGWQRTGIRDIPAEEAPGLVPRAGLRRIQRGEYQGTGSIEVQVYEMNSSGLGLDLWQRWHPAADTVFFYRENFFAVVKWRQADRASLHNFVRELEKRLGT